MHLSLSKHLVIKHTFLEFQSIDEDDSPKLRRHKSDPLLACARQFEQVVPCGKLTCKFEEPLTPTTCASSVTGEEEDEDATPSSPYSIDEDEASSQEGKFSFSSAVVSTLLEAPISRPSSQMPASSTPQQNANMNCQATAVWPQHFDTLAVLSTSPATTQQAFATSPCRGLQKSVDTRQSFDTVPDALLHTKTTLMVRNLPTDLSQPGLVQRFVEAGYGGFFDFVYMPMNFRGQGNFGYAFVNFVSHEVAAHVMGQMQPHKDDESLHPDRWTSAWSSCQGFSENIERYRNSPLMHDLVPKDCKPALYDASGNQIAFPKPTKTISKPRIHWPTKDAKKGDDADCNFEARLNKASSKGDGMLPSSVPQQRPGRSQKVQRRQAAMQAMGFTRCASSR